MIQKSIVTFVCSSNRHEDLILSLIVIKLKKDVLLITSCTSLPFSIDNKQNIHNSRSLSSLLLIRNRSLDLFLGRSFRQYLLDRLLFFQQEGSHNSLTNTGMASGSTVTTTDCTFSFGGSSIFGRFHVLDSGKNFLAIGATGSFGGFGHTLTLQGTTRHTNGPQFGGSRIVRVASVLRPAIVRHFVYVYADK
jgi:hypothetical protein